MADEEKYFYRGAGRVAFLARQKEIKEMVDAGHPLRNVYRKYGDKLNISYGQFARYVNKFIRSKPHGNTDRATGETEKGVKAATPARTRVPGQPAFVSSDTPRDKDSLLKGKG